MQHQSISDPDGENGDIIQTGGNDGQKALEDISIVPSSHPEAADH